MRYRPPGSRSRLHLDSQGDISDIAAGYRIATVRMHYRGYSAEQNDDCADGSEWTANLSSCKTIANSFHEVVNPHSMSHVVIVDLDIETHFAQPIGSLSG